MTRTIDARIAGDLAALGEDSRRDPVGLDDALRTTNMYRDAAPGAKARRDALAEERRRELVMMPLTLSHVFAHRVGRAAAGAAGLACTFVLLAMLADPLLLQVAAWFVPGLSVGMLIVLAALGVLAAYVVATWLAEAWFARRMRAAIRTGDDAYQDLDQLARGPLEIAQRAVDRVDGLSIGLFLAGASALAIAFGYVIVIVGAWHEISYAWSITAIAATGALARNLDVVVAAVLAVSAAGFVVGRACARETNLEASLSRTLGSWMALVIAAVVAIATLYNAFHMVVAFDLDHRLPSTEMRYGLAFGATTVGVLVLGYGLVWWRRREHARIGD